MNGSTESPRDVIRMANDWLQDISNRGRQGEFEGKDEVNRIAFKASVVVLSLLLLIKEHDIAPKLN